MSERHGPHWFLDASHFVAPHRHARLIDRIKHDIGHAPDRAGVRQVFIKHYYEKYGDPELPPSWMVFEMLSFGSISQAYMNLTRANQKPIAKTFNLDPNVLGSWLHALSYLRNLAAHHQRLWNRVFTIKPIAARRYAADLQDTTRFYAQAVMAEVLLKTVSPYSQWGQRLASLFHEYPTIEIRRLGFPADWRIRQVWHSATHVPTADTGRTFYARPLAAQTHPPRR